jgi:CSLREA domain-containing protein
MLDTTTHEVGRGRIARALGGGSALVLALALCALSTPLATASAATRAAISRGVHNSHVTLRSAPMHPAKPDTRQLVSGRRLERAVRLEPRATGPAATFVVNSLADSPLNSTSSKKCVDAEGSHHCSLRAAVEAANNLDRPVLIKLAAKTYKLTDAGLGALTVTNEGGTSIVGLGTGPTRIMVPAGQSYGVLFLTEGANHAGATLYLTGLSVSGGTAVDGAGIETGSYPNLSLILDKVTIAGNHATSDGGGIYVEYASLWATNSSISSNTSGGDGGAIYNYWGNLYLTRDKLNADRALDDNGGAIYQSYGNTHLIGGSVSGDTAGTVTQSGSGGGIYDVDGAVFLSGGVSVSHDSALNDGTGGAEYEYYSNLQATDATYSFDKAVGGVGASGGALYVAYSAHVTLNAVTMSHDDTSASTTSAGAARSTTMATSSGVTSPSGGAARSRTTTPVPSPCTWTTAV